MNSNKIFYNLIILYFFIMISISGCILNNWPEANIVQPQGGVYPYGYDITFVGSGDDIEDGQLSGSQLQWKSNIDGLIGEGTQFIRNDLSPGDHTITLSVTDNEGSIDTATTQITISTIFNNSVDMQLNTIPAGSFTMGSPEDELGRSTLYDETQHTVTLTQSFYIQTTEVTQGQWTAVMGEGTNPSEFSECGDDCPVETVTWYDSVIFCNRLSKKEGFTPSYYADSSYTTVFNGTPPVTSGDVYWNQATNGYRLPTEAEWEYSARAGTNTALPSGPITTEACNEPNMDAIGWYCGNNGEPGTFEYGTKMVAQKASNDWGLYDMHGNVEEWTYSRYGDYPSYSVTDPQGPSSGPGRVPRGGTFSRTSWYCRSAKRDSVSPFVKSSYKGFRVVLSPEK